MCICSTAVKHWQPALHVFVKLWACRAAPGRHHSIARFMNVRVKGAKGYTRQNKFRKVKKSVLLDECAHTEDRFVHLKAIMVMFSRRFNFQILHSQPNFISCPIRFICNEKKKGSIDGYQERKPQVFLEVASLSHVYFFVKTDQRRRDPPLSLPQIKWINSFWSHPSFIVKYFFIHCSLLFLWSRKCLSLTIFDYQSH